MENQESGCFLCQSPFTPELKYEELSQGIVICVECITRLVYAVKNEMDDFDHFFDLFGFDKDEFITIYGASADDKPLQESNCEIKEISNNQKFENQLSSPLDNAKSEKVDDSDEEPDIDPPSDEEFDNSEDFDPNDIEQGSDSHNEIQEGLNIEQRQHSDHGENKDGSTTISDDDFTANLVNYGGFHPGVCPKHHRLNEVVCLTDRTLLCPKCALFGEHTGHKFRELADVIPNIFSRAEELIEVVSKTEENENYLLKGGYVENLVSGIEKKKSEILASYDQMFEELIQKLNKKKKEMIEELNNSVTKMQRALRAEIEFPKVLKGVLSSWKSEATDLIENFERTQTTNKDALCFDLLAPDNPTPENDIVKKAEQIIGRMNEWEKKTAELLGNRLNLAEIKSKQPGFEQFIQSIELKWDLSTPILQIPKIKSDSEEIIDEQSDNIDDELLETDIKSQKKANSKKRPKRQLTGIKKSTGMNFSKTGAQGFGNFGATMTPRGGFLNSVPQQSPRGVQTPLGFPSSLGQGVEQKQLELSQTAFLSNNLPGQLPLLQSPQVPQLGQFKPPLSLQNQFMSQTLPLSVTPLQIPRLPTELPPVDKEQAVVHDADLDDDEEEEEDKIDDMLKNGTPVTRNSESAHAIVLPSEAKKLIKRRSALSLTSSKAYNAFTGCKSDTCDLTSLGIGDEGIAMLYKVIQEDSTVKHLKMMKNKITDVGAIILLKALTKNKGVKSINLNINLISDKILPVVVSLCESNKRIKKIGLKQNNISARGARDFVKQLQGLGVKLEV